MQEKKEKIDKKNKHFQCFRKSYLVQSVKNPCIFYDNQNKTLPIGQDLSTKMLVDVSNLVLKLKSKNTFKLAELEDEKDDFSKINVKTVTVFEFDVDIKKQD